MSEKNDSSSEKLYICGNLFQGLGNGKLKIARKYEETMFFFGVGNLPSDGGL